MTNTVQALHNRVTKKIQGQGTVSTGEKTMGVQNVRDAVLHTVFSAQKVELIRKYTIPEIKTNKLFRTN